MKSGAAGVRRGTLKVNRPHIPRPLSQHRNEALAHAYNTRQFDGYLGAGFWDDAVFDIYVI